MREVPALKRSVILGLISLVFTVACAQAAACDPLKVVVTIKPVHALVAALMEGIAEPVLIVEGAASPHTFTLKPSAARAISEADVFIRVSPALEAFTNKIVEGLPKSVAVVTLADVPGMRLLDQRQGGTFEPHVHEHEHAGPDDDHDEHNAGEHGPGIRDGHIWLDPDNAKVIVRALAAKFSAVSPANAVKFSANAAALEAKIAAMDASIAADLAGVKDKPFIVFHDAYQYFERHFGLAAAGSLTVSPDVQPSAKRLSAVRARIAQLKAACVFAEPGFQPNLVAAVTEGTTARAGTLDPEGVTLNAGAPLYFDLMTGLARNLKSCLQAGG